MDVERLRASGGIGEIDDDLGGVVPHVGQSRRARLVGAILRLELDRHRINGRTGAPGQCHEGQ